MLRAAVLMLLLPLAGCADKAEAPPGRIVPLNVWNRSQFALTGVYAHFGRDHRDTENLLDTPLGREDRLVIRSFQSGARVTVVRPQLEGGPEMTITTDDGLDLDGYGYTLVVFDTSFRLLFPESEDNPWGDTDDGGDGGDP